MRIRFPIRRSLLNMLLGRLEKKFGKQPYLSKLYKAMFTLAYYGLFRVGKIAQSQHVILAGNIHIAQNKDKILILLESSKTHCTADPPQTVKIKAAKPTPHNGHEDNCQFYLLRVYLALRKGFVTKNEQFFVLFLIDLRLNQRILGKFSKKHFTK